MSSHGRIPFVGLYVLPRRTVLQVQFTTAVEDMEVYDRMEYLTAIMCVSPRHLPEDIPVLVDDGEQFIWIVSHCLYVYFRCFFIQTMCPYSVCSLVQCSLTGVISDSLGQASVFQTA